MTDTDLITFDDERVIVWTDEDGFIRNVTDQLQAGNVPGVYVHDGALVQVARVQGVALAEGRRIVRVTPDMLRGILAREFTVQKKIVTQNGESLIAKSPGGGVFASIVSGTDWSGVPELLGINAVPVIGDGGTVELERGWSPDTRRYYHPLRGVPTKTSVADARSFLLDKVTRDLPFATRADRANYLAMMVTPLVREYLTRDGSAMHVPGLLIDAADAGTGKSLAADLIGAAYGSTKRPWATHEDEVKKSLLTAVQEVAPVVIFDNVARGTVISSSSLENMLTSNVYTDRVLGATASSSVENRKVWVVTGNNLTAATEMSARLVPVRLDAKVAHPAERPQSGFAIPNLDGWITRPDNQTAILAALISIVSGWVADGEPHGDHAWRSFTTWANAVGGLLDWLGVPGFLDNRKEFESSSDETTELEDVLAAWDAYFGNSAISVTRLLEAVDSDSNSDNLRTLRQQFFEKGKLMGKKSAGAWLRGQMGRVTNNGLRLVNTHDSRGNRRSWMVERV